MSSLGSGSITQDAEKKTVRAEVKDVYITDFAMGCAAAAVVAFSASKFAGGLQSNKK